MRGDELKMNKVANVSPDSSSGLFCFMDILNQVPHFYEYKNEFFNSFNISQINFDNLSEEYFFFENSHLIAFCKDEFISINAYHDKVKIEYDGIEIVEHDNVLQKLSDIIDKLKTKNVFMATTINYHAINLIEDIYITDDPYITIKIYRENIIFDKQTGNCIFLSPKLPNSKMINIAENILNNTELNSKIESKVISNTKRDYFLSIVKQAKEDIRNGEVFQIVLSQVIEIESNINTNYLFYTMKSKNPSEYSILINSTKEQIICFSPETLIKRDGKIVKTYPIAGTYRITREDDIVQKKIEILKDKKEISEHVMLVDLARNDLGRISKPGSVQVEEYLQIKRLYNLIHIYSVVVGELIEKNLIKAILSVFPAGTLTGAPKVRAMQLIDKYELIKRDLYGGAIGYIFKDKFDFAIAIRMAIRDKQKGIFRLQSGAGIVNLSVPEKEYEECLTKLRAFLNIMEVDENDIINR